MPLAVGGAAALAVWAGARWIPRIVLARRRYSVADLGFRVKEPESVQRVERVLDAFLFGMRQTLAGAPAEEAVRRCLARPPFDRPFAIEGGGMGAGAASLLRLGAAVRHVEEKLVPARPEYFIMPHVGLGVWLGFRHALRAGRVVRAAARVRRAGHRDLVFDGYGFQLGFFRYVKRPDVVDALAALPEPGALAAYQGLGRSLWFVFMDDWDGLARAIAALPEPGRRWTWAGAGLAATFTHPDRLETPYAFLERSPEEARAPLRTGIRLALQVRGMQDPAYLEEGLDRLTPPLAKEARADLALARRAFEETRDQDDFYRAWAERC